MEQLSSRKIGSLGEKIAGVFLEKKGYKVLKKNWTCRYGEIDLICSKNAKLIFIEVKFVQSKRFCDAVSLFTSAKNKNLNRTISMFFSKHKKKVLDWQLDLICITKSSSKFWIDHYKDIYCTKSF